MHDIIGISYRVPDFCTVLSPRMTTSQSYILVALCFFGTRKNQYDKQAPAMFTTM